MTETANSPAPNAPRRRKRKLLTRRKKKKAHSKPATEDDTWPCLTVPGVAPRYDHLGRELVCVQWLPDPKTGEEFPETEFILASAVVDVPSDGEPEPSREDPNVTAEDTVENKNTASESKIPERSKRTPAKPAVPAVNSSTLEETHKSSKRQRQTTSSEPDVLPPPKRTRRRLEVNESVQEEGSFKAVKKVPQNNGQLVVDVPVRANFDPGEYVPVPSSSPPTQPESPQPLAAGNPEAPRARAPISQTTIPDSQEVPDSLPSVAATVGICDQVQPLGGELQTQDLDLLSSTQSPPSARAADNSSKTDLQNAAPDLELNSQSRPLEVKEQQPPEDGNQDDLSKEQPSQDKVELSTAPPGTSAEQSTPGDLSFGERQVVTENNSPHSQLLLPDEVSGEDGTASPLDRSSSQHVLPQLEFHLDPSTQDEFGSTRSSGQGSNLASNSVVIVTGSSQNPSGAGSSDILPVNASSEVHSAQVIPPLGSIPEEDLHTDSQIPIDPNTPGGGGSSESLPLSGSSEVHSPQIIPPLSGIPEEDLHTDIRIAIAPHTPGGEIVTASVDKGPTRQPGLSGAGTPASGHDTITSGIVSDTPSRSAAKEPTLPAERPGKQADSRLAIGNLVEPVAAEPPSYEGPSRSASVARPTPNFGFGISTASEFGIRPSSSLVGEASAESPSNGRPSLRRLFDCETPSPSFERPSFDMDRTITPAADWETADPDEQQRQMLMRCFGTVTPQIGVDDDEIDGLEHSVVESSRLMTQETTTLRLAPMTTDHSTHESGLGNPLGLSTPDLETAGSMDTEYEPQSLPETIAPFQLDASLPTSASVDIPPAAQQIFESEEPETVLPGIESRQSSVEADGELDTSLSAVVRSVDRGANEVLVTLPMLSSTRALYTATLRANRAPLERYGACFASESGDNPDQELVAEIDAIYAQLFEHCDLPQFAGSVPDLDEELKAKHAIGTNSKFYFVHEFIKKLKDTNLRLLIISQPGRVYEYLEVVVANEGVKYMILDDVNAAAKESLDEFTVIIGNTNMDVSRVPFAIDVVILFDSEARAVDPPGGTTILTLVATHSIEHIDLRISDKMDPLERRNAMGYALAASERLLKEPPFMMEPFEVACLLADFVGDPDHGVSWNPQPIPDELFDFYLSSQGTVGESQRGITRHEATNTRKRLLQDGEDDVLTPTKRVRTAKSPRPGIRQASHLMSDLAKDTLSKYSARPQNSSQMIEIPIDQLEWLVARIARQDNDLEEKDRICLRLKEVAKTKESQLESFVKSVQDLQPKYIEAIRDRCIFEERMNAEIDRRTVFQQQYEASQVEKQALKAKVEELSAAAAFKPIVAPTTPHGVRIAKLETDLDEANAKYEAATKKLQSLTTDVEYVRAAYQSASSSASELLAENNDLKTQNKALAFKADGEIARIHEINNRGQTRDFQQLLGDKNATITQLEHDLDRMQKENRILRNGRRETRQSSVPRSPRLSMMSPRTRGGPNGGGAGSRGTSPAAGFDGGSSSTSGSVGPVPGMTYYRETPVGNPRLTQLRE